VRADIEVTREPEPARPDDPPRIEPLPADRFLNRELSWLDFNARVLTLAEDQNTPLLERAKFLAIFASNLDEFYMVRVAGLQRRLQTGLPVEGPDGLTPREQLAAIADRTADLMARHAACFTRDVEPALADENVQILRWVDLDHADRDRLRVYFREQIFPVLTPLAVDPAHPFPYISGLSLSLAVVVRDPDSGPELFARIKVPNNVPRFVSVDSPGRAGVMAAADGGGPRMARFVAVEELIAAHLGQLFSGMQVIEHHLFRVTRNAELEVDDDRDEDLLQALERELARRRFGPPVRLEVASTISDHVLDLLVRELDMDADHVVRVPGLLDLSRLWQLYDEVDRPDLKDRPFVPATHPQFVEGETPRSVFARLRDGDVLVHHPYHSFSTSVQRFIEQAAADPNVLAIKQTLYRTSGDSPVVDALIAAARAGKQVVVLVELKARFDEEANIGWARMLERAGCHVVYGLVGLKTHCKTAMVVRQEGGQLRRYCHIGTGNYHPKTARVYEDFGLLTADPDVANDLTDLFNVLTGYSRQTAYSRCWWPRTACGRASSNGSSARSSTPGPAAAAPCRSRSTLLWTKRSRRALPGQPGRRGRRPDRARHLHAAPGRAGPVGADPGALDRRAVPGALAAAAVPQRRRRGVLDRIGRPHAPQPGPPGRGTGAHHRPGRAGRAAPGPGHHHERRHRRLRPPRRRPVAPTCPQWTVPIG
jgi:polyphosphate kinase